MDFGFILVILPEHMKNTHQRLILHTTCFVACQSSSSMVLHALDASGTLWTLQPYESPGFYTDPALKPPQTLRNFRSFCQNDFLCGRSAGEELRTLRSGFVKISIFQIQVIFPRKTAKSSLNFYPVRFTRSSLSFFAK